MERESERAGRQDGECRAANKGDRRRRVIEGGALADVLNKRFATVSSTSVMVSFTMSQ